MRAFWKSFYIAIAQLIALSNNSYEIRVVQKRQLTELILLCYAHLFGSRQN